MISRFFLGPPGFESDRRLVRQIILCIVWFCVAALELHLTAQLQQTMLLIFFWAALMVISATMASFGVRLYLGRRKLRRTR